VTPYFKKKKKIKVWGCISVVEHLSNMSKVWGREAEARSKGRKGEREGGKEGRREGKLALCNP
jgi:hypothetical protein